MKRGVARFSALLIYLLSSSFLNCTDTLLVKQSQGKTSEPLIAIDIQGPKSVETGQEFQFDVQIKVASILSEMVQFYYCPPKELAYVSHTTTLPKQFVSDYSPEYNMLFGEGCSLPADKEIIISIRLKALEQYHLRNRTEIYAPSKKNVKSYFSFLVYKDGQEIELSKRKTVQVFAAEDTDY